VSNLTDLYSDYISLIRIPARIYLLKSWNNEIQSELHAIEQTVNVINSSVYFVFIFIQRLIESGPHILLSDTYYEGRVLLIR